MAKHVIPNRKTYKAVCVQEKRPAEQQHVGPIKLARMDGGHVLTVYRDQYGQEHQGVYQSVAMQTHPMAPLCTIDKFEG